MTRLALEPASGICLGTGGFGTAIARQDSFRLLDLFVKLGGRLIDSAHVYASWLPDGEGASERTIGEWIAANGARDSLVIGTKGGHPPLDRMQLGRCSRDDLESDLAESLQRLGVETIDVYWLHRDDKARTVEEIVDTLEAFVRQGRIRGYGASNWTVSRIESANRYAAAAGLQGFTATQPGWALADLSSPETEAMDMLAMDPALHEWHSATLIPAVPYSSQANGFFGTDNVAWARDGFTGDAPRAARIDTAPNRVRLLRAMELSERKGCSPNQAALAYLLNQPFPVYPIVGTSNPDHLREAFAARRVALGRGELAWLAG